MIILIIEDYSSLRIPTFLCIEIIHNTLHLNEKQFQLLQKYLQAAIFVKEVVS